MAANIAVQEDHASLYTNVPQPFLDALMRSLRPAFCIEVGSWKGGSANRIAAAAAAATPASAAPPCLLCIDTWLGDGGAWIDRCTGWRDGLLLERGLPQLLWQFVANVRRQHRHVILPWPCSSLTALRALQHIVLEPGVHGVPRPDFVYLDSGHEKGESLLEITRAFDLLRPGGVLAGDDLDWWAVESDLRIFVSTLAPGALVPVEQDEMLRELFSKYERAAKSRIVERGTPNHILLEREGRGITLFRYSSRQWLKAFVVRVIVGHDHSINHRGIEQRTTTKSKHGPCVVVHYDSISATCGHFKEMRRSEKRTP
jgi:hypothetical protein